jgi:hypothetical protein
MTSGSFPASAEHSTMTGRQRKLTQSNSTARERSFDVLSLERRGYSLSRASKLARTDPRTVRRYARSALRKVGGRWLARPFDRIPREMNILTPTGPELVVVRDSRAASKISAQSAAVARYRNRGDERLLHELGRSTVTVAGRTYRLQLDTDTLDRLIEGAELHYELYAR